MGLLAWWWLSRGSAWGAPVMGAPAVTDTDGAEEDLSAIMAEKCRQHQMGGAIGLPPGADPARRWAPIQFSAYWASLCGARYFAFRAPDGTLTVSPVVCAWPGDEVLLTLVYWDMIPPGWQGPSPYSVEEVLSYGSFRDPPGPHPEIPDRDCEGKIPLPERMGRDQPHLRSGAGTMVERHVARDWRLGLVHPGEYLPPDGTGL